MLITKYYSQSFFLSFFIQFELIAFFCSYFKNRVQRVFIRGSYSSEGTVKYGVPKGQSWDLYSSAFILMTYLYIYHQTLQNAICSHMTQHFIQQVKVFKNISTRKIDNAHIKPHIDYVSAVWDGCSEELFKNDLTLYIEGQAN